MKNASPRPDISSLKQILGRISLHLCFLSENLTGTEEIISKCSFRSETFSLTDLKSLQELDRLKQSIVDMATLLKALSKNTDPKLLDISNLKLEETRSFIFEDPIVKKTNSGSIDWF